MASNSFGNLLQELTCKVCMGLYTDPVALPECGNFFCGICLNLSYDGGFNRPMHMMSKPFTTCPLCRTESKTYGDALMRLPSSTKLTNLVALTKAETRNDKYKPSTDVCDLHPHIHLIIFCHDCETAKGVTCLLHTCAQHKLDTMAVRLRSEHNNKYQALQDSYDRRLETGDSVTNIDTDFESMTELVVQTFREFQWKRRAEMTKELEVSATNISLWFTVLLYSNGIVHRK